MCGGAVQGRPCPERSGDVEVEEVLGHPGVCGSIPTTTTITAYEASVKII